jgi:hypothetical protein
MSLPDYQYEPLTSETSFRVLRLLPARARDDTATTIEVELLEANFDNPPEYEAVSYAWGVEGPTAAIVCNGKRLCVTPNVLSVLRVLRPSDSSRVLWIDSIAIDQSSIAEKNIQVPKMHLVYQQARRVLIWLGKGSFEVEAALDYILEVSKVGNICLRDSLDPEATFDLMQETSEPFQGEHKRLTLRSSWAVLIFRSKSETSPRIL